MKNSYKKLCAIILVCISLISNNFVFAETNEEIYIKENKLIIENLSTNLSCAPHTGNVNLDYLYQMLQQNKASIDMAKNLLNNNGEDNSENNKEVDQVAKDTIKNETITIASIEDIMKTLIDNLTEDKAKENSYMNEYNIILKEMLSNFESLKPTGDINKDLLQTMIVHQESTIKMANSIIKYSDNVDVKKIAQNDIVTKKTNIEIMKNIINNKVDYNKKDNKSE